MREIWFGVLLALGLVATVPAAAQAPKSEAAQSANLLAQTPQDRVLGKPDAPVTIVEYGSLTCPHCAHFENDVLPKIQKQWIDSGKARLIFRDFPLNKVDIPAATLARCMPPAKFYPFVETLYRDQENWAIAKDYQKALERLAHLAGLSTEQIKTCLNDKGAENRVIAGGLAASQQLGVNSTPTFFINGKKFEGEPTAEGFEQALSAAAAKS